MTPRDPDRVMIQIQQWWSRSSDDLDPVQRWWSRSSDDPDPVQWWWSISRDDPDLMMKMTWRWIWLEDEDDLKTKMIQLIQRRRPALKIVSKEYLPSKRECWCICNFEMYSSMYLIYCNPMFISGCFYYVFESCCHAPMFRLGGLIM